MPSFVKNLLTFSCISSAVICVENLRLNFKFKLLGVTLCAPTPAVILVTCKDVGGKCSLQ